MSDQEKLLKFVQRVSDFAAWRDVDSVESLVWDANELLVSLSVIETNPLSFKAHLEKGITNDKS